MANQTEYRYDVYVSYNEADAEWVLDWLLPRLKAAKLAAAIDEESFRFGVPVVEEIERSIRESRHILAVLSPAYVAGEWDNFESQLVQHQDPGARFRRLIPLLLEECDPPDRIELLHWVDLTDAERREAQLQRVIATVQGQSSLPELRYETIPDARQRWWELRWLALIGLVAVATLAVTVAIYLRGQGPSRMAEGVTGVAVAAVGQLRADGSMVETDLTRTLSQLIDESVAQEVRAQPEPGLQLWHNGLPRAEKGMRLDPIAGATAVQREEAAHRRAEQIGATVVIYAHLTADNPPLFVLEFYNTDPLLRSESNLTIGRYQFGDPVRIPADLELSDPRAADRVRARVTQRVTTLYWLLRGLHQDMLGNPARALEILERQKVELEQWEQDWNLAAGGKDVLHFFLARSLLFLDRDAEAQVALETALSLSPNFVQAQITMGTAFFERVNSQGVEALLPDDFAQTIDAYRRGVALAREAQEPLLLEIAQLALGIALRQQGDTAFFHGQDDAALAAFGEAIPLLQEVQPPLSAAHQYRLVGQAAASAGMAHYQQAVILAERGEPAAAEAAHAEAAAAFSHCIEQSSLDRRSDQILLNDIVVGNCWPMRAATFEALGSLQYGQAEASGADEGTRSRLYAEATATFTQCTDQRTALEQDLLADGVLVQPQVVAELDNIVDRCRTMRTEAQARLDQLGG